MMNLNMGAAYEQASQEENGFAPIPAGDWPCVIENAEYKQFNSGNWGVNVQLSITNGAENDGRKFFDVFVMFEADGPTEKMSTDKKTGQPKNFGRITYAKLCQAVGLTPDQASDPVNLIGKMVVVKSKVADKNDGSGEKEGVVSYYKPVPVAGGVQQAPQQQAQQGGFQQPQQQMNSGNFGQQPQQSTSAFAR